MFILLAATGSPFSRESEAFRSCWRKNIGQLSGILAEILAGLWDGEAGAFFLKRHPEAWRQEKRGECFGSREAGLKARYVSNYSNHRFSTSVEYRPR